MAPTPATIGANNDAIDDDPAVPDEPIKSTAWCFWAPFAREAESELEQLKPRKAMANLNWISLLADMLAGTRVFWLAPGLFVAAQLAAFAWTGGEESFFGMVTGGVVESLSLDTGAIMRWHMFSASAMWALGAVQFLARRWRQGAWAPLHRGLGRLFLGLWFAVAGPSAFYLSLYSGTGPSNAQVAMTAFSVVSMETTVLAFYYFWMGWRVAVRRRLGAETWRLHKKAMGAGLVFTMTILFQRFCQLILIACRKAVVLLAEASPGSWTRVRWVAEALASGPLDHNVNLALSTCWFGAALLLLLDGPRSRFFVLALELDPKTAEELFGDEGPGAWELGLWRGRLLLYLAMRGYVTKCWTIDPNPKQMGLF